MNFRPCIDIHNGAVKQIVGGSLRDESNFVQNNFISDKQADYYANLYREHELTGGHVILLNPAGSDQYAADLAQARLALAAYPGGLQIGGGVTADNAEMFLEMGASAVIVTSYVFKDGKINYENLRRLSSKVGCKHLVLDVSCRYSDSNYYVVTDRWQRFTDEVVCPALFEKLAAYCAEFLVHAVDSEGKAAGIDERLVGILASYEGLPITYAGGVGSMDDLKRLKALGNGRIDVTIGSALDLFGGSLSFRDIIDFCRD